jgi:hypothetical protein
MLAFALAAFPFLISPGRAYAQPTCEHVSLSGTGGVNILLGQSWRTG